MSKQSLTPDLLRKYALCLPFADEKRGYPETIRALEWAADEIERLRCIVDKLPKTEDGVPVVPGKESA